jgi:hypothetical protein
MIFKAFFMERSSTNSFAKDRAFWSLAHGTEFLELLICFVFFCILIDFLFWRWRFLLLFRNIRYFILFSSHIDPIVVVVLVLLEFPDPGTFSLLDRYFLLLLGLIDIGNEEILLFDLESSRRFDDFNGKLVGYIPKMSVEVSLTVDCF